MKNSSRVAFVNLGCRVNRVEIDDIALALEASGAKRVAEDQADVVVINTCAVTGEAEAKARKAVRHAAQLENKPYVLATGCVASLFADELVSLSDRVIVEADKSRVPEICADLLGTQLADTKAVSADGATATGRTRPGIKVQDGCDRRCSYCIVWKARGAARSLAYEEVAKRVRSLAEEGASEVVLTGINLGSYSSSRQGQPADLTGLLAGLLEDSSIGRLRLSSVEPQDITPELCELIAASEGRIAPFLHVPLQAGSDATLSRMAREYTCEEYASRISVARDILGPDLSLGCDVIVGFPGETDEEFAQTYEFCKQMAYSKMHIFRYSKRPGTPAAEAPDQVAPSVMAARARELRHLASDMRAAYALSRVGKTELICVESAGQGTSGGLLQVEFDFTCGREKPQVGTLVSARVTSADSAGTLKVAW